VRCCGEHVGEHIENLVGTHWKIKGNILGTKGKWKKFPPLPPPFYPTSKLKRKKSKAPWVHHALSFPLATWSFSSQKSSSPFLAWAKTPCKEHRTYWGTLSSLGCKVPSTRLFAKMYLLVEGKGTV
jgi:hypothetical protein